MNEKHIVWEDWEPGDPVDEQHLAACEQCRRDHELALFLRFQARSAPTIEPPPFFAARVAKLAMADANAAFWRFLERAARQLIPVFALLLLATSFLIYRSWRTPEPMDEGFVGILLGPGDGEPEVSLDDVVALLKESAAEDEAN